MQSYLMDRPVVRNTEGDIHDKSALMREEIKAVLAQKYGTALAASKDIRDKAWVELTEHDDAEAYKFNCEQAAIMAHYADGILAAAEALGINKDELVEAAESIRVERGLQDES